MEIKQFKKTGQGNFIAYEGDKEAGEMGYTLEGNDQIVIEHTNVLPEFEGKGIGKLLLMKAVDFARQNSLKVIPVCPFAKSVFDKTEEIKDVLFGS